MIVRGGRLIDQLGERTGDLVIDGDKIAAVSDDTNVIDVSGKIVLPGIVDLGDTQCGYTAQYHR